MYGKGCHTFRGECSSQAFNRSVYKDLVLRTDLGPQYISNESKNTIKLLDINLGYIQLRASEDYRDIESFQNSIKTDYIWPSEFMDFHEASPTVGKSLSNYGECRLHSSIHYLPSRGLRRKYLDDSEFREKAEKKEVDVKLDDN